MSKIVLTDQVMAPDVPPVGKVHIWSDAGTGRVRQLDAAGLVSDMALGASGPNIGARNVNGVMVPEVRQPGKMASVPMLYPRFKRGTWTAGANGTTPPNHGTDFYPFMVVTALDDDGYPHEFHGFLEPGGGAGTSSYRGYADGYWMPAGAFVEGQSVRFIYTGTLQNTAGGIGADAFIEFVIEPGATVGGFTGANRIRLLSEELGMTWSTPTTRPFKAEILFTSKGIGKYAWHCIYTIGNKDGTNHLLVRECDGEKSGGFDFYANDCLLNLRFRMDDIANIDTYDDTYQGTTTSRLDILSWQAIPEGS